MTTTSSESAWWIIDVHGYGEFAFHGTEAEAEEMRAHKTRWEGGIGEKRLADPGRNKRDRALIDRAVADDA